MDLVKALTNSDNLITGLVAVAAFATIVTVAKPMLGGQNLEKRMKSVSLHRDELKRRSRQAIRRIRINLLDVLGPGDDPLSGSQRFLIMIKKWSPKPRKAGQPPMR